MTTTQHAPDNSRQALGSAETTTPLAVFASVNGHAQAQIHFADRHGKPTAPVRN